MPELPWEDSLLERKGESDLKDLLKTLVAFANSVKPNHVAVILIGEQDDGSAKGVANPDNIQKSVRKDCDKIFPPILWRSRVYERDGRPCVRVEIEYSGETPHFGGPAWIRAGSETVKASDKTFQSLIEFRLSKVRELAQWINREITIQADLGSLVSSSSNHPHWPNIHTVTLRFVNSFWASFEREEGATRSEPLEKIVLSWDDHNHRLRVLVKL